MLLLQLFLFKDTPLLARLLRMEVKAFTAGVAFTLLVGSLVYYVNFTDGGNSSLVSTTCTQDNVLCTRPKLLNKNCSVPISTGKGKRCYPQIARDLYIPRGYAICSENAKGYWLELTKQFDCAALFQQFLHISSTPMLPEAPKEIPPHMYNNFTLNGYIPVEYAYIPYTKYHSNQTTIWKTSDIDAVMQQARKKDGFSYGSDETNGLYDAVGNHSKRLQDATVLVLGSESPWVEAIALVNGAKKVVTAEYAKLYSEDPRIFVEHPVTLAQNWEKYAGTFDVGISFSSLEHPGLGRYTDPLCPDCDFLELQKAACLVKPGGLFFLALPQGQDRILFNAHRYYGMVRLPLLTANWKLIDYKVRGWKMEEVRDEHFRDVFILDGAPQGVMVLENTRCQPCTQLF